MKSIDTREKPADHEGTCFCGKRILVWHKEKRVAHEKPECAWFTSFCEGLKSHENEGEIVVIEPEKGSV